MGLHVRFGTRPEDTWCFVCICDMYFDFLYNISDIENGIIELRTLVFQSINLHFFKPKKKKKNQSIYMCNFFFITSIKLYVQNMQKAYSSSD